MYYRGSDRFRRITYVLLAAALVIGFVAGLSTTAVAAPKTQPTTQFATVVSYVVVTAYSPLFVTFTEWERLTQVSVSTLLKEQTTTTTSYLTLTKEYTQTMTVISTTTTTSTSTVSVSLTKTLTESVTSTQVIGVKPIVLNEVELNPRSGRKEWVELYNPNSFPMNVSSWKIFSGVSLITLIPAGSIVPPREYMVIELREGDYLPNSNACITLRDSDDRYVDSTPCISSGGLTDLFSNEYTWQRVPDGSNFWDLRPGTPGGPNS